ncbi:trigger factor [Deinococcus peraridilitoris]|uniref:Trigger factor n=1 Tax=Deinococcus peraridilitoris (strain DSM 19664 / LMG 22246 / CIP 109416 / KR-200) TaxID=937777 RepID=L0A1N9_DEIPD|nr:trigger factor [Deinococcus peraridilitoris]AFZ67813.1 trigger factor [Deinococcus peraridilitoris DSM 19664]
MAELIKRDGNKVEFRVTVPKADVQSAYNQVWSAVSRDVRVPGFRPGKAPRSVIEKRVGRGYIESEVRDRLLENHYPRAVRDLKLNLVDAEISPASLKEGNDFDFTVKGETYPEVKLPEWKGFQLAASAPEITDDVLERTLSDLQERNATFESVERPAEGADMVTIEELGEEGGSYPIYLDVAEEHVRAALTGKSVGDEVTIEVPAHSHGDHEHPAHSVQVKIVDIKHKQLQELNDEFAKGLNFDSLERLRTDLRGELERRARQEGDNARREEFVTQLTEGMTVDIPATMIDRRREAMLSEIQDDLGRQGVKWDEYETFMKEQDKLDDFMNDLRKNAETRVKRDLALEQLAEDLNVGMTQAELDANLNSLAQANRMTVQQLRSQLGPNGLNGYYATLVREKALSQAVARLGEAATAKADQPHAAAIEGSQEPVEEPLQQSVDEAEGAPDSSEDRNEQSE